MMILTQLSQHGCQKERMEVIKMNHTVQEIFDRELALMQVIKALNEDYHDNCDLNNCHACVGD
jgi:hypothetical protein